ncbi:MAG: bifunctional folylpolyglutamate synthase/dihydrofolate synthase [Fibrobacter sp.]|nr:bifunctional folylpolyglutamate synthase/dihydrofolate synthase [Fibrobacter sp.]
MNSAGIQYLESRLMFGMVPGLESTFKICEALGNPQESFRTIHVVGTNGKGSCSYYLAGVLQAHGLKTGLYTSPHLISLRERIRVNDTPVSDVDLDRLFLQVKAAAEAARVEPTFFEVVTVAAFLYYREQGVQVAVLEAGMGGRLDSTAVARGNVAVLTSIGLEHTEVLGATESAILKEKMAVMPGVVARPDVIARNASDEAISGKKVYVVGGLSESLLVEARDYAAAVGAELVTPATREDIELPNLGRHYVENASLSLAAAKLMLDSDVAAGQSAADHYDDKLALKVLKTRSWPGRMQQLFDAKGSLRFILDGTHNSHAARRLAETLDRYYPGQKFPCVFGALKDKDVEEMLRFLAPYVSEWHLVRTPYERFREPSEIAGILQKMGSAVASTGPLSREVLDNILDKVKSPALVTGSLYMIGEVIDLLKNDFDGLAFFRGLTKATNEHR